MNKHTMRKRLQELSQQKRPTVVSQAPPVTPPGHTDQIIDMMGGENAAEKIAMSVDSVHRLEVSEASAWIDIDGQTYRVQVERVEGEERP